MLEVWVTEDMLKGIYYLPGSIYYATKSPQGRRRAASKSTVGFMTAFLEKLLSQEVDSEPFGCVGQF